MPEIFPPYPRKALKPWARLFGKPFIPDYNQDVSLEIREQTGFMTRLYRSSGALSDLAKNQGYFGLPCYTRQH